MLNPLRYLSVGISLWFTFTAAAAVPADRFTPYKLSNSDKEILDGLEYRSFLYFWEQAGSTGIVRDRARADGLESNAPSPHVGSAAATGFGLTAICIGVDNKWITRDQGRERILTTLTFLSEKAPRERGWFYHYMDVDTGDRVWSSEISSIDSALLLAGVITAGQKFSSDPRISALALSIYEQVDFQWMLNGDKYLLSHGWTPESGFLRYRWSAYSELMILYMLAIGSPTHGIPREAWYAWKRPEIEFEGTRFVSGGPLFTHQYSHAWIDFRMLRERSAKPIDWFANSIAATEVQRSFCYKLAIKFPSYSADMWGITASDSAAGYTVWGEPPRSAHIDGTIVPSAAGGSLMFVPEITLPVMHKMYEQFGATLYKRYGFADAFNPAAGWVARDVVGIDVGIILLSAENLQSGSVWQYFMSSKVAIDAIKSIGFEQVPKRKPSYWRNIFKSR